MGSRQMVQVVNKAMSSVGPYPDGREWRGSRKNAVGLRVPLVATNHTKGVPMPRAGVAKTRWADEAIAVWKMMILESRCESTEGNPQMEGYFVGANSATVIDKSKMKAPLV